MNKNTYIIGFMLFSLFFGAGNLIYPPTLGIESGTSYWIAISGFIITGVGLPILAVVAISFVKNDARELADHVHPLFGLIFTAVVYLAIGPFFGIPRAASVAYEMGVVPFISDHSPLSLFIFTTIFFLLVFIVSLNPTKMVDRIGQLLTPVLFLTIIALSIGGFLLLKSQPTPPTNEYIQMPFFTGFVEGYLTMDAIAALAFGIIVINAFKERGITSRKQLIQSTLKAGLVTGFGLIAVYASIGWIGAKMSAQGVFKNGGDILSSASNLIYGDFGVLLLGIIVTLACFTTSVGLVVATGQFFSTIIKVPYKWIMSAVIIGSYLIANQGLESIISYSVPILIFIYPIAIVLIILTFIQPLFNNSTNIYRWTVLVTSLISLYDSLVEFGFPLLSITPIMDKLPLSDFQLGWVVPATVVIFLGILLNRKEGNNDR